MEKYHHMHKLFDTYILKARLSPAFLCFLPLLLTIVSIFPEIYESLSTTLVFLATSCGLLIFTSNIVRYLGRKKEKKLCSLWGGLPATTWLRHDDVNLDPVTKKRYHGFLKKNVPGLKLPKNSNNSNESDHIFNSAVKWLIEHTRNNKKFPLIFEENITYGFRRNMLAIKWISLFLLVLDIALILSNYYLNYGLVLLYESQYIITLCIASFSIIAWICFVSEKWVKDAAFSYARALLASCDQRK